MSALLGSLPGLANELSDIGRLGSTPSMTGMAFNLLGASFGDCGLIRPFASGDRIDGVGIRYRIAFRARPARRGRRQGR